LGNGLGNMKKLQIGIYSTEPVWLEKSKEVLENYGNVLKNNLEIHTFENASEVWGGGKTEISAYPVCGYPKR